MTEQQAKVRQAYLMVEADKRKDEPAVKQLLSNAIRAQQTVQGAQEVLQRDNRALEAELEAGIPPELRAFTGTPTAPQKAPAKKKAQAKKKAKA